MTVPLPPDGSPENEIDRLRLQVATLKAALEDEQRRATQRLSDLTRTRVLLESIVEECPTPTDAVAETAGVAESTHGASQSSKLERSEHLGSESLALALEGSRLGTWDWDLVSRTVAYDRRWCAMLGYGPFEIEPTVAGWEQLIHPQDRPGVLEQLEAHLRGQTDNYEVEHRLRHKDGSWVWVMSRGRVIARDPRGNPLRAAGTHLDISERKSEEQTRLETLDRLRKLVNEQRTVLHTVSVGIVLVKARRIEWANPEFARMLGYDARELQGMESKAMYFDLDDWDRVGTEGYAVLASAAVYVEEYRFKRKDGCPVWCQLSGQAIDASDLEQGSIWVFRDATEQRRAEQALFESEHRFERLVQNSNDIIAVTDDTCTIISVSATVQKVLGYTAGQLIGTCAFDIVHPDDADAVKATFKAMLQHPGTPKRIEYRHRHANGDSIACEVVGTNLLLDPLIKALVFNVRDISERRNAELEHAKLTAQLQQAMKMEAVGRLAGGIAHDFNNLLTAILGNIELARLELERPQSLPTLLGEAMNAARSAASLTRQLLAFSRKQIIEPRTLDLNVLVENLRRLLTRIIGEDIRLELRLDPKPTTVRIDPGQFEQVLVNMVVNARDAMPQGGSLVLETANLHFDAGHSASHPELTAGPYVMLAVSDAGIGMSEQVKAHLFEPFFTTKPKGRGTGLGLATIFGVVKQAGGSIEAESEVGKGSTFRIYLPHVGGIAEVPSRGEVAEELPLGDETVLLVEDEESVRTLACAILKRLGYVVLSAGNGTDALHIARSYSGPIAVLLTDVVMPGMNGRELAERVCELRPATKVLYASGYTENLIVHQGVVDEGMHFIGKPYSVQSLALKLREVLDVPPRI